MEDNQELETPPLPPCSRCNVPYRLVGIEPTDKSSDELYTFECAGCGDLETRTVRTR